MTDPIYAHPARINLASLAETDNHTRWRAIAERRAMDPTSFANNPPFFIPAEISSDRVDNYYTRMDPATTLPNFARDMNQGLPLQNSHKRLELPLGQSLEAAVMTVDGAEVVRGVFYTIPGLQAGEVSTDSLILGVRSGVYTDLSIGFYGGEFVCEICNRNMLTDSECRHVPGFHYMIEGANGKRVNTLAVARIKNASSSEASVVYNGSTPGASVLKAQVELDQGRMSDREIYLVENTYRVALVRPPKSFGGVTVPEDKKEDVILEQELEVVLDERIVAAESTRAILSDMGAPGDDIVAQVRWAQAQIKDLTPLAADGRQYRQDLVDEAIKEGVRALGNDFQADLYRSMLTTATIEQVKRMRDDWRALGDSKFAGGPVVKNANEPEEPAKKPVILRRAVS